MMQIESGGGKKKKGQPTKADTRVDFTPMVDMIMLLLTFFMLATTLSKPQTMEIALPSKEKSQKEENKTLAKESEAMTFYLGADDKVYYFEGMPDLQTPNFLIETNFSPDGMRAVLLKKNRKAVEEVNKLKEQKMKLQIGQEEYNKRLEEIKKQDGTPTVIIKPLDNSTYNNLVTTLDEMLITSVGKYAITNIDENDKKMLKNSNVVFELVEAEK